MVFPTTALLVLLAALTACTPLSGDDGGDAGDLTTTDAAHAPERVRLAEAGADRPAGAEADAADEGADAADEGADAADAADEQADAAADDAAAEDAVADLGDGAPASGVERVIKDGTVTVEVGAGEFDAAFAGVIDAATRLGGTVVSSTTTSGDDATSGSVTVRVPVDAYERLLVGVGEIGRVVERAVTAEDVTAEFTDLESRLRHLQAQERFYLALLQDADGVADAIAVRQQLDGLQSDLERVKGRLQLLDARTTFSTLTVELFEPGAPPATVAAPDARPELGRYWAQALDAFVNVVGTLLIAVFFVAPLLLPAGAAVAVWRLLRPRAATVAADAD